MGSLRGQGLGHRLVRATGELIVVTDVAGAHVHVEPSAVVQPVLHAERPAALARMAVGVGNNAQIGRIHDQAR